MENTLLYCGDCNEEMKNIPDESVDCIFTDLPYASKTFGKCVDCKWDVPIDLDKMWDNFKRIRKDNTPIFFTCNMKFAVDLINSNIKEFRYDLIWVKSAPVGFLCVSNESSISVKDRGDIKIKDVKINDYVKSKNGYIKVLDYFDNGNKDCFKITTNNNLNLILTKDHKIETKTGLKALKDINIYNQELILTDNGFDYIKTIEYVGIKKTCDIEVEHIDHTYYCNNISISNSAKKMPMRKHEIVLCFYKKLPFYDLSSHKHKFIKRKESISVESVYGDNMTRRKGNKESKYEPKLPNSIIHSVGGNTIYGNDIPNTDFKGRNGGPSYEPPLPTSILKNKEEKIKKLKDNWEGYDNSTTYQDKQLITGADWKKVNNGIKVYDPPLPTSILKNKEELNFSGDNGGNGNEVYRNHKTLDKTPHIKQIIKESGNGQRYNPPLPTSILKVRDGIEIGKDAYPLSEEYRNRSEGKRYDPPLPTSIVDEIIDLNIDEPDKEEEYSEESELLKEINNSDIDVNLEFEYPNGVKKIETDCYSYTERLANGKLKKSNKVYEPKLPTSVLQNTIYGALPTSEDLAIIHNMSPLDKHKAQYEPKLPTSLLEIKSSKGRHATEKPVGLMSWVLKYYTKPGDVVLDCCMGSGSTGVSCVQEGRNFIGIEKDKDIFEVACQRIYDPEERDIKIV